MEVEVTQEYTGQQRHIVYLAPMWKGVLDFDMRVDDAHTPVQKTLAREGLGGMVGVSGVGRDHWLGSPLAMANFYAFGRLAWDPNLAPKEIAEEWVRLTLSNETEVVNTVTDMLMQSWPAYVNYTGSLGMQTLTNITGSHYGPNIESSEQNGWGQWHHADHEGVGMDRTVPTGTGFTTARPLSNSSTTATIWAQSKPRTLLTNGPHSITTSTPHSTTTCILASNTRPGTPRSGAT